EGLALALAAEDVALGAFQVPQQFAAGRVAHHALHPDDGRVAHAARHRIDVVQGVRRVGDGGAGVQLEGVFHAAVGVRHQLAAVVAPGVGQEHGDRDVGAYRVAQAAHHRGVDVR